MLSAVRSPLGLLSSGKTSQSHLITPEEESPFPGLFIPYNELLFLDVLNSSSMEVLGSRFRVVSQSEGSERRSVVLPLLSPEKSNSPRNNAAVNYTSGIPHRARRERCGSYCRTFIFSLPTANEGLGFSSKKLKAQVGVKK